MHRFKKSLLSLASAAVLLFLAAGAQAADYYVDVNTGDDANPGTAALPWKTIQKSLYSSSFPGSTIHVAAGTYHESLDWPAISLKLQGAGKDLSIIDPSVANGGPGGWGIISRYNITATISGFTIRNAVGRNISGIFSMANLTVRDCKFTGNGYSDYGGGIYAYTRNLTVIDSEFTENIGSARGGGILTVQCSNVTVTNCLFSKNTANYGAGIYNDTCGKVTVKDCTFTESASSFVAGGIYNEDCTNTTVTRCLFSNNAVTNIGGAMVNYRTNAVVTNCMFTGNSGTAGGAMSNWVCNPTVTNCAFVGNSAGDGGGLYNINNSNPTFINCTFAGNSAYQGGGIYSDSGASALINCILWGNSVWHGYGADGPQIYGSANVTYSDVQGGWAGTGNFSADPLFLEAPNGNVHLALGSPCRNVGNNAVITSPPFPRDPTNTFLIDLDGNPRIGGGVVDLGAYEREGNAPPTANDDSFSANEDTPLIISAPGVLANDTDPDYEPLTASLVGGPAHGTLTLNTNGSFTYTPVAGYSGPDSFTYEVSDGTFNSNVATVSLTIHVNYPPVANDQAVTTDEDTPYSGTLTATDGDGNALTFTKVSDPAHGTLTVNPDGAFTYTPAANYNGDDSFTFKANDGTADSNTATVSITVDRVNDPPTADDQSVTTNEDTPYSGTLTGSDVEGDALTFQKASDPAHGTVTVNMDGSFTYTPNANYNGSDSFTFKVNDGTVDSNTATVSITVAPVNDAPVADDQSVSTDEDTPYSGTLTGSDIDGDTLTYQKASDPAHGTVTVNGDGSFTYTPAANYSGPDSFTYQVNDGKIDSNTATVSITVNPVNDAPVATNDSYSANQNTALTVAASGVLANDTDAEGDALSTVLVTGPAHGTVTLNADGSFTYTPASGYSGSDFFTYKANDGSVDSNMATITINVIPAPPVTFSGHVVLEGCVAPAQPVTFEFRDTDLNLLFTRSLILGSDGSYSLSDIPRGNYDVRVKGRKWLAQAQGVDATSGDVNGAEFFLRAGDIEENNLVDVNDLHRFIEAFDASAGDRNWNENADLNCDGMVDVEDLSLLIRNFDKEGDL